MESIEKLRGYCNAWWYDGNGGYPSDVKRIADDIEAEIANRYMELPLDADGVPIRVGDRVETVINGLLHDGEFTVRTVGANIITDSGGCAIYGEQVRHVKTRTIEDVLRELVSIPTMLERVDAVAKYADEIRGLM